MVTRSSGTPGFCPLACRFRPLDEAFSPGCDTGDMDRQHEWLPPQPATQPPAAPQPPAPPPWEEQRKPLLKRVFGPVAIGAILLFKYAAKLKFLLVAAKGAKFLTTSVSMLVSIGAYTLIWGWKFAVGFVALLFIHEMGHYIQLRREGIRPSGMVFIPFLGAAVAAKSLGRDALAEARVGLAGPILGSLAAAVVAAAGFAFDSDLLKALAFTGFFLNLFNLLPVVPLDGGRAMAAMAPWMWFVGLGAVFTLVFVWPNPILIIIALFGVMEVFRRWKHRGEEAEYYRVKPAHRLAVGAVFVGLIVLLALGMDLTHIERDFNDV
jgi:Zn-dependent protease